MISCRQLRWTWVVAAMCSFPLSVSAQYAESFRAVLQSSELGPDVLMQLRDGPDYAHDDWKTLLQVFNRLDQFYDLQSTAEPISGMPETWQSGAPESVGELFEVRGMIVGVKEVVLPEEFAEVHDWPGIYRCTFEFSTAGKSSSAMILTTHVPNL